MYVCVCVCIYIYIYTHTQHTYIFFRPTLPLDDGLIESKHAVEICASQAEELIFVRRRQK